METENTDKRRKKDDPNYDKEKAKLEKYDARGVQTLYRTLSRNHYNLLRMVDNKASIILTVNSIIISLLMGAMYLADTEHMDSMNTIATILIRSSLLSMILAVVSMLPHRYIKKTLAGSNYKGTLYAGNFYKFSLEEFKQEFRRITNSGNDLYNEMEEDLYYLGKVIDGKQRILWFSVLVFLLGLIGTFVYSTMNGLHFGHP